jgi:hypothetical protein
MLRASIRNSRKIDKALGTFIDLIFYTVVACVILSQVSRQARDSVSLSAARLTLAFSDWNRPVRFVSVPLFFDSRICLDNRVSGEQDVRWVAVHSRSTSCKYLKPSSTLVTTIIHIVSIVSTNQYNIGDRIHISNSEQDTSPTGSSGMPSGRDSPWSKPVRLTIAAHFRVACEGRDTVSHYCGICSNWRDSNIVQRVFGRISGTIGSQDASTRRRLFLPLSHVHFALRLLTWLALPTLSSTSHSSFQQACHSTPYNSLTKLYANSSRPDLGSGASFPAFASPKLSQTLDTLVS